MAPSALAEELGLGAERTLGDPAEGWRGGVVGVDRLGEQAGVEDVVHPQPVRSPVAADVELELVIGDPRPELPFDTAVYFRGAVAVHALRLEVGDRDLFRILRAWTTRRAGGHGTIPPVHPADPGAERLRR
jgi:hypothetical protein